MLTSNSPQNRTASAHLNGSSPPRAAFFGNVTAEGQSIEMVFTKAQKERIARITDFYPVRVTSANFEECLPELQGLEVIFCTWGMLHLTDEQVARLPAL